MIMKKHYIEEKYQALTLKIMYRIQLWLTNNRKRISIIKTKNASIMKIKVIKWKSKKFGNKRIYKRMQDK
jgi:hypothetical protein